MIHNQRPDPLSQAREIWATIKVQRWGILLATVLLVAIAIVVITLLPDHYSANTTVLFDPQRLPEKYVAPTVTEDPAQRLNTLTQEVLSAERLQQISQQLHLYADAGKSPASTVDRMRKDITIDMKPTPGREMTAFGITYTHGDPQMAATVANRLAQSFIDWDLANRAQQASGTAAFMAGQLQDAKQLLDGEAAKMQEYKTKYAGELPEQLQSNMQALTMLHTALQANSEAKDRLEQEKTALATAPENARSSASAPTDRDRLEAEKRSLQAELSKLRAEYTEQYPDVITTKERLADVTSELKSMLPAKASAEGSSTTARLQVLGHEIERLQAERAGIQERIEKCQARVDATPLREQKFDTLDRNYTNARDQYEGLLDKKFHADMAMDLERQQKASRFTVDPAQVPVRPTKPNRAMLLTLIIPLCFLIPTGIAIAHAEVRGTVNTERALRSLLPESARVVGRIPVIETPSRARKQRRLALLSILGSALCCLAVIVFLWGGPADRMRRNHARRFTPSAPTANLLSQ